MIIDTKELTKLEQYIKDLEIAGYMHPDCSTCQKVFYNPVKRGILFSNIFAPSHKASRNCESGKRPHCTCDTCF